MTKFKIIRAKELYVPPKITGPIEVGKPIFPGKAEELVFLPKFLKNDLEIRFEPTQLTSDFMNDPGVKYMNPSPFLLPKASAIIVRNQTGIVGFLKGVLQFIGNKLVEAFQHPPWFGGPFIFMIFGRFLFLPPSGGKPPSSPPALTDLLAAARPDLSSKAGQVKVEDLPPQVAELVKSLFEINKIDEYEHAGIAIQLANGTVLRRGAYFGGDITSWDAKQIRDGDAFMTARGVVLGQARIEAARRPELFPQPVTIYLYHTHPYRKPTAFTETPLYEHTDGRTYTLTNESDAAFGQQMFEHMVDLLRKAGFTGPIEMQAGAIPTRKGKAEGLYVATYFLY